MFTFIDPTLFKFLIPFLVWIPFVELGVGIPFSLVVSGLPAWQVALLAFGGHAVGIIILTSVFYRYLPELEARHPLIKKLVDKARTVKLDRYLGKKEFGIIAILALPIPFGGMWLAVTSAFVFDVPKRRALIFAIIGSALGTIQFTFVSQLIITFLKYAISQIF